MLTPEEIRQKLTLSPDGLATSIRAEDAAYLHQLVLERKCAETLETGFAYGFSAAHMLGASTGRHVACDPFQENFQNAGLSNLQQLGLEDRLEFHRAPSHAVLPALLAEGRSFDLALIDGDHRYDGILVDFYYAALLLRIGGVVVFHDTWMRSTVLVASFIRKNRKDFRKVPCPHRTMVVFEKVGEDTRKWNHFREFYSLRSWSGWMIRKLLGKLN
jgi:predicted O-methyltransferase YrrM